MATWHYTPDFKLRIKAACPACGCIDLYTIYADYYRADLRCNKCDKRFDAEREGAPDPAVKDIVRQIRDLVTKANELSIFN